MTSDERRVAVRYLDDEKGVLWPRDDTATQATYADAPDQVISLAYAVLLLMMLQAIRST